MGVRRWAIGIRSPAGGFGGTRAALILAALASVAGFGVCRGGRLFPIKRAAQIIHC